MTLRQFLCYYRELPEVLKLTSPWGGGDTAPHPASPGNSGKFTPTPQHEAEAILASFGIQKQVKHG